MKTKISKNKFYNTKKVSSGKNHYIKKRSTLKSKNNKDYQEGGPVYERYVFDNQCMNSKIHSVGSDNHLKILLGLRRDSEKQKSTPNNKMASQAKTADIFCSFCGKSQNEITMIFSNALKNTHICKDCIANCNKEIAAAR